MDSKKLLIEFEDLRNLLETKNEELNELNHVYYCMKETQKPSIIHTIYRNNHINLLKQDEEILDKLISEKKRSNEAIRKKIDRMSGVNKKTTNLFNLKVDSGNKFSQKNFKNPDYKLLENEYKVKSAYLEDLIAYNNLISIPEKTNYLQHLIILIIIAFTIKIFKFF